ncbi:hypothetical protein [Hoeflea sp.]|uniref:hypothetical protein n=1 Tax=Hoeflea sp. TaxID=1940281 RepID=UPI0019A21915|nr:hypothetical protein [Hoeflea sp.]MBC7284840.1 hypothetical protein [Hoeflea sp.]
MIERLLPERFAGLESWVDKWALETQVERERVRRSSSTEELKEFYNNLAGDLEPIVAYLNDFPLQATPPPEQKLLNLLLSLAEVAPHVELYRGDPRVPYSFEEERFIAEHGNLKNFNGELYARLANT